MVDSWVDAIDKITILVAGAGSFAAALIISADVTNRYGGLGIEPFSYELASLAVAFICFLAAGYTLSVDGHVRVSILRNRFPQKAQQIVNVISYIIIILFVALLLTQFYVDWVESFTRHSTFPGTLQTVLWVPQLFVLIGLFILELDALRLLAKSVYTVIWGDTKSTPVSIPEEETLPLSDYD